MWLLLLLLSLAAPMVKAYISSAWLEVFMAKGDKTVTDTLLMTEGVWIITVLTEMSLFSAELAK